MNKPKPCVLGPKHKWSFVGNVTHGVVSGTSASFVLKGRYHCQCGERKFGPFVSPS